MKTITIEGEPIVIAGGYDYEPQQQMVQEPLKSQAQHFREAAEQRAETIAHTEDLVPKIVEWVMQPVAGLFALGILGIFAAGIKVSLKRWLQRKP